MDKDGCTHIRNHAKIKVQFRWKLPYYYAGTLLYDLVSWGARLKWSRVISKETTLEEFPMLREKDLKVLRYLHFRLLY